MNEQYDVPWPVVLATLNKLITNEREKLEAASASIEDIRFIQGRINLAKELLQLPKRLNLDRG
jgi:hypothetical protein